MENEPCTLYELEPLPAEHPEPVAPPAKPEPDSSESDTNTPPPPSDHDEARAEIERMISEMGAEKVVGIIHANRNAAIEQIKSELSAGCDMSMPTGRSVTNTFNTIFDLASQA